MPPPGGERGEPLGRGEGPASLAGGPIDVAPLGGPRARLTLRIDADEQTRGLASAPLAVEGFLPVQLGPGDLPLRDAVPCFRWRAEDGPITWPVEAGVEIPADGTTLLVAWLDLDGDGRLRDGDRCSTAVRAPLPGEAGGDLAFVLERAWAGEEGLAAPAAQGRSVVFEIRPPAVELPRAGLLVLGFEEADLTQNGFPERGGMPRFSWSQPSQDRRWPAQVQLPIDGAPGLFVFGVVDVDGDLRLGPGDQIAVPEGPLAVPDDPGQPIVLVVDQVLPGRRSAPRSCGGGS